MSSFLCIVFMLEAVIGGVGTPCVAYEESEASADWWIVRPSRTEPTISGWAEKHPDLVSLDSLKTLDGHTAYAVTVTDARTDGVKKQKILFSQPHAHEPAATAGMMDFLAQLLDGKHLDGRPTDLKREELLRRAVLSFIPDGNPDGRARAPVDWWDGKKYDNDEFLKFAFGHEADGRRCKRVGRFSVAERCPARIGIVYERINENEFVEPNRDSESTYFKLVHRTLDKRNYDLMVDIHQTEFARSKWNASIILPFMQNDLPKPIREANRRVGRAVIEAWRKTGASPDPTARPLGYGKDQLRYFRKCWGGIYAKTPTVIVEVQNNNVRTPPKKQMEIVETSIRASIETIVGEPIVTRNPK